MNGDHLVTDRAQDEVHLLPQDRDVGVMLAETVRAMTRDSGAKGEARAGENGVGHGGENRRETGDGKRESADIPRLPSPVSRPRLMVGSDGRKDATRRRPLPAVHGVRGTAISRRGTAPNVT